MSDFIPFAPTAANLDRHVVARVIGAGDIKRLSYDAAFLLGYNVQPIAESCFQTHTVSPAAIVASYTRNPGVNVIIVGVEPWVTTASDSSFGMTFTPSSGAIAAIATTGANFFDGSTATAPRFTAVADPLFRSVPFDVTGLPIATAVDLTLTATTLTGSPQGIRRLKIIEVPVGAANVTRDPTAEVGVAAAWTAAGNPIDSDTLSSPGGFARLLRELERAETENRRQWQALYYENTTGALRRTNINFGELSPPGSVPPPHLRLRVRRLDDTSVPSPHRGAWRCWVTGGTGELRLKIDGTVVQTWTGITNTSVAESPVKSFDVPCNTTLQYVRASFEGKCTVGNTVYASRFRGIEDF